MIIKYEEYINEGFYDWMNKKATDNKQILSFILTVAGSFFWIIKAQANSSIWENIWLLVIIMFYLPMTLNITRSLLRNTYNKIRSTVLLTTSDKKYKQIKAFLEKYPDLEQPLFQLKIRMNAAVKNNDKIEISKIIHELYKIKKNINKREKVGDFFLLNDEENQAYQNREAVLNQIDPLREEDWNENN